VLLIGAVSLNGRIRAALKERAGAQVRFSPAWQREQARRRTA
jgi:hypothetical protein